MNSLPNFQIPDVWEVKDVVNKLKSVVLNYTEMEAKVHEATSNDPWGASSTLMQEIAQGTYNYQYFNEIMPTIYRRFTEKESKQWRQIYKSLVLLEYLIKNGSERVVDDARSHVSMIKILRNFYYIDDRGKDEGINVRNRAKEIIELLSNTEKIRSERKLAKKNRTKYIGVGSEGGSIMGSASSSSIGGFSRLSGSGGSGGSVNGSNRYVGFGSDSFFGGSSSNGGGISFNGDALSFGEETPYPHQSGKYDEEEEDDYYYKQEEDEENKKDEKSDSEDEDDDWGEFTCGGVVESKEGKNKPSNNIIDDDFADFQQATEVTSSQNQQQQQQGLFDLLSEDNITATPTLAATSVHKTQSALDLFDPTTPSTPAPADNKQEQKQDTKTTNNAIDTGMWAQASNFLSLDSLGKNASNAQPKTGPSMNTLKSNSVQASWNNWASNGNSAASKPSSVVTPKSSNTTTTTSSAFDDLLS
ncbi:MAG: hypothetical protein EXX96DRAFT_97666 [Benjaminiella poitrasii]|nr:MAG: hypothetical protein EXX96DRAFT_97666 [Benjaminiella poitrasii]